MPIIQERVKENLAAEVFLKQGTLPMRMTGGKAVVKSLAAHGVQTVFGIPGTHNLAIYDALLDEPHIQHIVARHEQGAAFMADGYARASGKVGVCLSTTGPAALNTATPLMTAYCDSTPVLSIASQIPSDAVGQEKGYLHECRDQLACFRPIAGWCRCAESVAEIPEMLKNAFALLSAGRPRPVALEIPFDLLDASDDVTVSVVDTNVTNRPAANEIEAAVELLSLSERPVIWAGGGVISSGASVVLCQLAEKLQAPMFSTTMGKGAFPNDHPLAAGNTLLHNASRDYLSGCDLMLAVGTRFSELETKRWKLPLPEKLIHIDVDPNEMGRSYSVDAPVVGDAKLAMAELVSLCDGFEESENREREVADLRARVLDDCRQLAPQVVELAETIRDALPRETIVVNDMTMAAYWCQSLLDIYEPRTHLYPWGACTLGFGLPAAIGAKLACPEKPVVLLSGDGGFLFNCQELATAVQFNVPVVVILSNNDAYGVLKPQQETRYGRTIAVELTNPDFGAMAHSFGANAQRVESVADLKPAIATALKANGPTIIELPMTLPWPTPEAAPWE